MPRTCTFDGPRRPVKYVRSPVRMFGLLVCARVSKSGCRSFLLEVSECCRPSDLGSASWLSSVSSLGNSGGLSSVNEHAAAKLIAMAMRTIPMIFLKDGCFILFSLVGYQDREPRSPEKLLIARARRKPPAPPTSTPNSAEAHRALIFWMLACSTCAFIR